MTKIQKSIAAILAGGLVVLTSITAMAESPMVDGVVKELRSGGELTVKHGPLPNLDMPAMTMVFKTADPAMAKGLKVGDKIKMHVEDKGGKLTIMKLQK